MMDKDPLSRFINTGVVYWVETHAIFIENNARHSLGKCQAFKICGHFQVFTLAYQFSQFRMEINLAIQYY